ncbi:MAG: polysaccharide deacetylase family protein [Planctomycetes bacterium]|nr:polysaccharide deacetylase family protein [Planctomycetota bacterium]
MDALLAFHGIDDSGSVLSYPPDQFDRLLDLLQEAGVSFVSLDQLLAPPVAGAAAAAARHRVALTFDDGLRSVHAAALPRLARRRLPFTVYVVADWIGRDNRWPGQPAAITRFELMGETELRELQAAGATLGGHTANHVDCRGLAPDVAQRELQESRTRLEQRFGAPFRHFAWPYGRFDAAARARVVATWESAATTLLDYLPADVPAARHDLPRLDSWYLRDPARRLPLFAPRTRAWIAWRRWLRRVRGAAYGS